MTNVTLHLGELWHTPDEPPFAGPLDVGIEALTGGIAVGADGRIAAVGAASALKTQFPSAKIVDHGAQVLLPGFIDTHVHFPQIDIIGSYGERLLGWLSTHTFPAESQFGDTSFAEKAAARFVTELLANGTTLASVFSSSHPSAAHALFGEADRRGVRMIVGKTSMDRGAPADLLFDAPADLSANERLIRDWHGKDGRLFVALTPRFALSCTPALLNGLGALRGRHPSLFVQSHHAETPEEIAEVKKLFPNAANYLSVYDQAGLLGERTIMAHAVHAEDAELKLYRQRGTSVSHCPTSNLFLGSGLFPLKRVLESGVTVGLGTDVGGGTSFSMLKTMGEAYKVQQLRGDLVTPARLLYQATLGGARALGIGAELGSFAVGKCADFQVLDWRRSRLLPERWTGQSAAARLFALCFLGDDRLTKEVYVGGRSVFAAH